MASPTPVLLERFETLSTLLVDEIEARRADDAVHSALWPTVGAVASHVVAVYRWVTTILRTGSPAQPAEFPLNDDTMTTELRDARAELLAELERADRECWVLGGHTGTTAFWRRRMVLETLKHLLDVRTSPDEQFAEPAELDVELAVDGIDEFLDVFLARSRATLAPLPGSVLLTATDARRSWRLASDWSLTDDDPPSVTIEARAGALLLMLWERANPLDEPERFRSVGDREVMRALLDAPIHP